MRPTSTPLLSTALLCVLALDACHGAETALRVPNGIEPRSFGFTGRIVNGTKAAARQFPHQVSLRRSYSAAHFCGGSIIKENVVLTAAHCMYQRGEEIKPWTILVIAGELTIDTATKTGQRRGVESVIVHPLFQLSTLENDAAVLILKVPFNFTAHVRPALLPLEPLKPGVMCQVSGWGYPSEDDPEVSNDLMYVDLPILARQTCRRLLVNATLLPPGMYCAGYIEGGKDACQGDSGGGMVCRGVLAGVVSGGEGCACPLLPGVYADVFYYRPWLKQYTRSPVLLLETRRNGADRPATGSTLAIASIGSLLLNAAAYAARSPGN